LENIAIKTEALKSLDARFKATASLKEVIVNVDVYNDEDLSDDLGKKMRDYGWIIEVTELVIPESDPEEDHTDYEFDLMKEEEREDQKWEEVYYRKKRDPLWKNDSDYD